MGGQCVDEDRCNFAHGPDEVRGARKPSTGGSRNWQPKHPTGTGSEAACASPPPTSPEKQPEPPQWETCADCKAEFRREDGKHFERDVYYCIRCWDDWQGWACHGKHGHE